MLIDRNNVIKLGDFGIARRLQNDGGSAIKGTTRYIAPEVVSDKFGPFLVYEKERREPWVHFITRERLQQFVDSLALT